MNRPEERKTIPVGWWRFDWPIDLNARMTDIERSQPTLLDLFSRILAPDELSRFIRAQNGEQITEEHFALLIETVLGDCKKGQSLTQKDWMQIFDSARYLITDVVRRNYEEKRKRPNVAISDGGIRLKECRCYSSLFRSMIPLNHEVGMAVLENIKAEYSGDVQLLNILDASKTRSGN